MNGPYVWFFLLAVCASAVMVLAENNSLAIAFAAVAALELMRLYVSTQTKGAGRGPAN